MIHAGAKAKAQVPGQKASGFLPGQAAPAQFGVLGLCKTLTRFA
jgi:hypothetical protein